MVVDQVLIRRVRGAKLRASSKLLTQTNAYKEEPVEKIRSIHYLRGIAALLVVAFHLRSNLNNVYAQKDLGSLLFSSGSAGVDLFFIISGFIIALSTSSIKSSRPVDFIVKRFFRIYPMLTLSLIALFFIMPNQSAIEYLRSAIPLHLNYHDAAPFFGFNSLMTAWTLTFELFFYILFVISMSFSHKNRTFICTMLIVMLFVSTQMYYNGSIDFSGHASAEISNVSNAILVLAKLSSSPMMLEFVFGMLLFEYRNQLSMVLGSKQVLTLCIVTYIVFFISGYRYFFGPLNFGLWGLILAIGTVSYEQNHEIKHNSTLSFFGDISYSIYLVHILVIEFFRTYWPDFPIYNQGPGFARFIMLMSISIGLSFLSFRYIEMPCVKLGKRLTRKSKPLAVSA
jgi:peptidoglycan/LPS O-acetylase OafA/YrhL